MICYFLGPQASYTHQAALKAFPDASRRACPSIPSVFNAVIYGGESDGLAETTTAADADIVGIIPVENSTNGPVAATLDLLADNAAGHRAVQVVGEVRVAVRHCLLVGKSSHDTSAPAANVPNFGRGDRPDLSHLRLLHTHPQAWGQCKAFLAAYNLKAPSAPPPTGTSSIGALSTTCHDASSTSSAAALAAADATGETAAISSALAAEAHGATIILEGLEDSANNMTRFLVLRNSARGGSNMHAAGRRRKALVTFVLAPSDPSRPGALSDALGVFKNAGLSLTSINTRPRGGSVPWEYCFIVEVDLGIAGAENADRTRGSAQLDRALEELGGVVGEWLWRGTWDLED